MLNYMTIVLVVPKNKIFQFNKEELGSSNILNLKNFKCDIKVSQLEFEKVQSVI